MAGSKRAAPVLPGAAPAALRKEEEVVHVLRAGRRVARGAHRSAVVPLDVEVLGRAQPVRRHAPRRVAIREQPAQRLVQRPPAVALLDLDEDRRTGAGERLGGAGQDGRLVPLDVALDECHARRIGAQLSVQRREADVDRLRIRRVVRRVAHERALLVGPAARAGEPELCVSRRPRQPDWMQDDRTARARERAQPLVAPRIGLEGVHAPALTDQPRHAAREQAHRRSRVHHHLAGGDQRIDEPEGGVAPAYRAPGQVQPRGRAHPAHQPRGEQQRRQASLLHSPQRTRECPCAAHSEGPARYGIWTPEIARAMTSRWISEVPSKIV